ncbi:MAG TPA: RbsD/FucU domain-containing protein [Acetobacteraceae bacterium]|nr:RbsD/FucU domain-containing protein [Acetobacteraceae bacterium]
MLKTLGRLHTPDLLYLLASMGHGDELAVVDAHFPAPSLARRLVRLDGADLPETLDAILALLPLDGFVPDPALRMEVVDRPEEIPDVQRACQSVIDRNENRNLPLAPLERHAFYARAREAFGIVMTGELRPYGCILVKKGIVI